MRSLIHARARGRVRIFAPGRLAFVACISLEVAEWAIPFPGRCIHMMSSLAGRQRIVALVALAIGPGISAAAQQPLQSQWVNSAVGSETHSSGPDQSVYWATSALLDQLFSSRSRQSSRPATLGLPDMFFAQSMTCASLNGAWCNGGDVDSDHMVRGAYDQSDHYAWFWTRSPAFFGQSWSQPSAYSPGYFFWSWSQPSRPHDDEQGSVYAAPTWTKKSAPDAGDAFRDRSKQAEMGCKLGDASCMQATPEPGTLALLGTGLATLGAWRRRRRTGLTQA
jgi:PEP-CTERM motif